MTDYIPVMINGIFTGLGVICGQWLWQAYIYPKFVKRAEEKLRIKKEQKEKTWEKQEEKETEAETSQKKN